MPAGRKRGPGPKACDPCARAKLACDGDNPCEGCLLRHVSCSWKRVEKTPAPEVNLSPTLDPSGGEASVDHGSSPSSTPQSISCNPSAKYLLQFTLSSNKTISDLRDALEIDTCIPPDITASSPGPDGQQASVGEDSGFPFFLDSGAPYNSFPFTIPHDDLQGDAFLAANGGIPERLSLQRRIPDLSRLLQSDGTGRFIGCHHSQSARRNPVFSKIMTLDNAQKALHAFFRRLYPYHAGIHQPSFNIDQASPHLLLAIIVAGSIYTLPRELRLVAFSCLDTLEHVVFESRELEMLITGGSGAHVSDMQLDLVNAAVIAVYLQLGMRGKLKFWRTWNIYFPMVLAAARSLSLFSTRKAGIESCSPSFFASWDLWVKTERMIRTGFSIYLLDGQVSILFRTTPKINLNEMVLDIPSREAAFRARTCEDWILMDPFLVDPPATSFATFMQQLMADSDMDISESTAEAIPFSALLFAICAFHNLIFLSQANPLMDLVMIRLTPLGSL
ncbi:uncharacterized protein NECHADRAFT_86952 [Fusarium vanettenii 77-13-4]|uniref:Zn(2)-C6 fungal-type domain-containing protein n=1 Tax=Fusarium vanettenii (strain ATCC MYA-4622 / CBS 123669 / FGSC 9596 / NRRL 45880 / 77-13-4) TaxID=660122 RepID=C7ZI58_FUSV7|nr:uncharacterized protein NECHADRAFT_86952 [Fusarium vanettenii 77-13-4]EEU36319.1 hypothetical protein NECHADRAFT_86952 [Fusarium vanettenii 77-13-4]